ncbi:MAG TPA: hypothetical protein VE197_20700, partial [Mycobacterium sp.]|nr:hypothetical protein [Mycobacterium sp.]
MGPKIGAGRAEIDRRDLEVALALAESPPRRSGGRPGRRTAFCAGSAVFNEPRHDERPRYGALRPPPGCNTIEHRHSATNHETVTDAVEK